MNIEEVSTGKFFPIKIVPVEKADYKFLVKSRYFFNWKDEQNEEVYKLTIKGENEILGVISLERIYAEWRVHIRLLSVSKENKGSKKKFDKIAGNLIAHAAKIAVAEYGELACISLRPKTELTQYYIEKYKMNITGITLSLEVPEIIDLINLFDNN
ncbi:N-acetyltransferase [Sediminibacterium ginsengisoli]|uniref:N-acetyltransferase domain-containing protein n=1 Tax=Sediminibacterium ginsengisoli TaxID=413434 RepID=A0A1T4RFZ8_9BACT|nr:N-acetyltransferase [Sediminibacterium ginsengisoli]SKA14922.1 hypothetical protein SAMN04488132_11233 [Sediminibacterium ginsengisoli]